VTERSNKPANAGFWNQRQAFWRANHLVEKRVHEIQGATKLAPREVAFPNFKCDALGGVPGVGAESHGP